MKQKRTIVTKLIAIIISIAMLLPAGMVAASADVGDYSFTQNGDEYTVAIADASLAGKEISLAVLPYSTGSFDVEDILYLNQLTADENGNAIITFQLREDYTMKETDSLTAFLGAEGLDEIKKVPLKGNEEEDISLGDINGDRNITAVDALLALKVTVNENFGTEAQRTRADVDGDGSVTTDDVLKILKCASGIESIRGETGKTLTTLAVNSTYTKIDSEEGTAYYTGGTYIDEGNMTITVLPEYDMNYDQSKSNAVYAWLFKGSKGTNTNVWMDGNNSYVLGFSTDALMAYLDETTNYQASGVKLMLTKKSNKATNAYTVYPTYRMNIDFTKSQTEIAAAMPNSQNFQDAGVAAVGASSGQSVVSIDLPLNDDNHVIHQWANDTNPYKNIFVSSEGNNPHLLGLNALASDTMNEDGQYLIPSEQIDSVPRLVITLTDEVEKPEESVVVVKPDPTDVSPFNHGKFEGWGTSLAWWANTVGYNEALTEDATEKMFDEEKGLGLDIARYNIGGGDDPTHDHITRIDSKMPGFASPVYQEDGTTLKTDENGRLVYNLDWDKDVNQVNVLKKAREHNSDLVVEAFCNSAPYFMTNSGCTGGGVNGQDNLKEEYYQDFAELIAKVAKHFKEDLGIKFQSISPMNEPSNGGGNSTGSGCWNANNAKQEGCNFWQTDHQSDMVIEMGKALEKYGLREDTVIAASDDGTENFVKRSYNGMSQEAKDQIDRIDIHTYGVTTDAARTSIHNFVKDTGKKFWMSEVGGSSTAGTGAEAMGNSLWFGEKIIHDLNNLRSSAWVMWQAVDNHIWEEELGTRDLNAPIWGLCYTNHMRSQLELNKKYYAYGQFTRYIHPGDTIIASSDHTLAAYNEVTGRITIVAINTAGETVKNRFDLSDFVRVGSKAKVIRTSGSVETGENWAQLDDILVTEEKYFDADLKANSITTFVIDMDNTELQLIDFGVKDGMVHYNYEKGNTASDSDIYTAIYDGNNKFLYASKNRNADSLLMDTKKDYSIKVMEWKQDTMAPRRKPVMDVVTPEIQYAKMEGSSFQICGTTIGYSVTAGPGKADLSDLIWSVTESDGKETNKAEVDADGQVTAKSPGTVYVKAVSQKHGFVALKELVIIGEEYISVQNVNSGYALGTKGGSTSENAMVSQQADASLRTAQWQMELAGDGWFYLKNRQTGLYLNNVQGVPSVTADNTTDNAKWSIETVGGNAYKILNKKTEKALRINGATGIDGATAVEGVYGGTSNEQWTISVYSGSSVKSTPQEETAYRGEFEDFVGCISWVNQAGIENGKSTGRVIGSTKTNDILYLGNTQVDDFSRITIKASNQTSSTFTVTVYAVDMSGIDDIGALSKDEIQSYLTQENVLGKVAVVNTGSWSTFAEHSGDITASMSGRKSIFAVLNSNGANWSGNYDYLELN